MTEPNESQAEREIVHAVDTIHYLIYKLSPVRRLSVSARLRELFSELCDSVQRDIAKDA